MGTDRENTGRRSVPDPGCYVLDRRGFAFITSYINRCNMVITVGLRRHIETRTGSMPDYNGGSTKTHKLFDGSSAINKAGQCGLATDQRGSLRFDGMCDSGAYEFAATCRVLTFKDRDFSTGSTLDFSRCIIEVGPNVGIKNSTTVKFTAGKHLVLGNGFSVEQLSKLEVFLDPALDTSMLTSLEAPAPRTTTPAPTPATLGATGSAPHRG